MIAISLKDQLNRSIVRYAIGASLLVAVAMGFDWSLAFLLPVLSLSFLAPGGKPPSVQAGLLFIAPVAVACMLGLVLADVFLPMPPIHIMITFLLLFHIFYTRHPVFNPMTRVWLIIAILLIPNIALQSMVLAKIIAVNLVWNAVCVVLMVWFIYFLFPLPTPVEKLKAIETKSSAVSETSLTVHKRFFIAITSTLVIMPVYLIFYYFEISSAILILIFIAIMSMQPGFAKDWNKGKALIVGNTIGGLAAILGFEILTVVPEFTFLILLVLLGGLIFGQAVFSGKPLAPVYGMAFSTFLLIIGSATGSGSEGAGDKVWSRVIQIMIAVVYTVSAFGLIAKFKSGRR